MKAVGERSQPWRPGLQWFLQSAGKRQRLRPRADVGSSNHRFDQPRPPLLHRRRVLSREFLARGGATGLDAQASAMRVQFISGSCGSSIDKALARAPAAATRSSSM
jgi:hypothetical protein